MHVFAYLRHERDGGEAKPTRLFNREHINEAMHTYIHRYIFTNSIQWKSM